MRAVITVDVEYPQNTIDSEARLTLLLKTFGTLGLDPLHLPERGSVQDLAAVRTRGEFLLNIAYPILSRMPEEKKIHCEKNLVFATNFDSSTRLMVVAENTGTISIRLWNPRMELAQLACEKLLAQLFEHNRYSDSSEPKFKVIQDIDLLEAELELPTIIGNVNKSKRDRLWSIASREVWISLSFLCLFLLMFVVKYLVDGSYESVHGHIDRVSTGFVVTFLVTFASLVHTYFRIPGIISWSFNTQPGKSS